MQTKATLHFDAKCGLCSTSARRWTAWLAARQIELRPIQDLETSDTQDDPSEMILRTASGETLGGPDALAYIARTAWWTWPLYLAYQLPVLHAIIRCAYRCLARHRAGVSRVCRLKPDRR